MKLTLVQAPRRQPDTNAVVHQDFNPAGPAVGKKLRAVRLRRTEQRDHSGQRSFSASAHVHGLGSEPDSINADHQQVFKKCGAGSGAMSRPAQFDGAARVQNLNADIY